MEQGNQRYCLSLQVIEEADSISTDHPNRYRIVYLPQEPEFDPELDSDGNGVHE